MSKKYILGIDLGTTKSVLAIYENGNPKIIENVSGKRTTPSVVSLKKTKVKGSTTGETNSEWIVGDSAKNQAILNPLNTLYGVKRLIGRRFDEDEVTKMKALASYKIVPGPNGDAWVEVDGKAMSPAEISGKVLRELKAAAEKYLGNDPETGKPIEVSDAVITVPAYFNDNQRKATRDAGAIAGLNVLRIINEPTAAALAYGVDKRKDGKIIVYDLGGGTFDVSLLEVMMDEKAGSMIKVLSTNGDTFLGGENFDERIMDHLVDVLKQETGIDFKAKKDLRALQMLKEAAEKAKIDLSSQEAVDINIPFLGLDANGEQISFEHTLTRTKLEALVIDLIERTKGPCQKALADAGLKVSDIDDIILVGAQTRMPKVVETVKALFGGKQPRQDVSVQEIVALGASVQGAILDGNVENVLLLDVIPLSIGIKTFGDVMGVMIPRNSTIPTEAKDTFSTAEDGQRNVRIMVYQGERGVASQNKLLGEFTLDGIPPLPKGKPQIEVTFSIDADGVLSVEAKDLVMKRAQKIVVKANGGLSKEQVEQALKDAEAHAESDRIFKEQKMASINAEELLKDVANEEQEEYFVKAAPELQETFRATAKELTEALKRNDAPVMVEKIARLKEVRSTIVQAFYDAAQAQSEATATPEAAANEPPAAPPAP